MTYEEEQLIKQIQAGIAEIKDGHQKQINDMKRILDRREIEQKKMVDVLSLPGLREYFPSSQEQKDFSEYLHKGALMGPEMKTLNLGDATLGGYLAPDEFLARVIEKLTEISPVRQLAWVQPTSATILEIPKETGQFDGAWVAELGERTETTGQTFGLEKIPIHECYALIKVSRQLVEDNRVNLDDLLIDRFARRLNKLEGAGFISGNGFTRPEGILQNTNVGFVVSGDANLITADGLVDLVYSLPSDYRKNAAWLMNRTTIAEARKLKDDYGRYLWERSFAEKTPETLLGYPIHEAVDMPDIAAGSYPIAFGDFKQAYCIADRVDIQVQVLREKYIEFGLLGYMGRKRVGGQVVLAEAIKKQKIAANGA